MTAIALHTDLYQLTMIAGYLAGGIHDHRATFELFIRRLPPHRAFVVAAGFDTALGFLASLRFSDDDIGWVRTCGRFRKERRSSLTNRSCA
jgi:nicotinate phosphoribosyltransferase